MTQAAIGQYPKQASFPMMLFASFLAHILAIVVFIAAPQFLPHHNRQPFGGPSGSGGLSVMTVDFSMGESGKPSSEPAPARYLKKVTEPEETQPPSKTEFSDPKLKKKNEPPAAKETLNVAKRKVEGPYGTGTDTSKETGKSGKQGAGPFSLGTAGENQSGYGTGTGTPFPFPWYIERVFAKIEINWFKPYIAESTQQDYATVVYFIITRTGGVSKVQVEKSSGVAALDRSAESAILGSVPFPPLPTQWTEPDLAFRVTFTYKPQ